MMYCNQCGSEVENGAQFCASCGTSVNSVLERQGGQPNLGDKQKVMRRLIGKNADYYLQAFERLGRGEKGPWMWPIFFMGWLVLIYRKAWGVLKKYYMIPLALLVGGMVVMLLVSPVGGLLTGIGSMWMLINNLRLCRRFSGEYLKQLEAIIQRENLLQSGVAEEQLTAVATKYGGTNPTGAIGLVVGMVILNIVIALFSGGSGY